MASSIGNFSFYLFMTLIWSFTVYKDYYIGIAFKEAGLSQAPFGGRWKYLTFIDMNIQAAYFIICFLNFTFKLLLNKKKREYALDKILNFLFVSLVFPIGMVVVIAFWSVYLVNRDLVYPKIMDTIMPQYQNHLVHTLPGVGVLVEIYLLKHHYSKSFIRGVIPTLFFASCYVVWVFIVNFYANIWVYPILQVLSVFYRTVFISCLLVLAGSLYWFGSFLNNLFWQSKIKIK